MENTLLNVLKKCKPARSDYNIAFVQYAVESGKLTENEACILALLLERVGVQQKNIAREVRRIQKRYPELDYTELEKKKRVKQEERIVQEIREEKKRSMGNMFYGLKKVFFK